MFRAISCLFAALLLLQLGACSTYHRRWTEAARSAPGKKSVTGAYAGRWQSDRGGFGGKLWCIVEPACAGIQKHPTPNLYRAEFRATWHHIFVSEHEILLHARPLRGGGIAFSDEAKITMWIGSGAYQCTGQIRLGEFTARYDAHYDQGTFRLARPENIANEQPRHLVHR